MNKPLTHRIIAALAASSVVALASAPDGLAAPPKPPMAAAWSPDKALAATLGPPADLAGYKMRLPSGTTAELKKDQTGGGGRAHFFSIHRADDAGPTMLVVVVSLPPGATGKDTVEQLLTGDGFMKEKADAIKTPPQAGRVSGLQAVRQYFKYTRADGRVTHGFHYGLVDGARRLLVVVVDEAPRSETSLPLAEAAVLTLRK